MRFQGVVILLTAAFLLVSCSRPDPEEVTKIISAETAAMAKEMESGAIDTALSRYVDDCVSLPNFGPRLKGKQAIKAHFAEMMGMMKMSNVNFKIIDIKVDRIYAIELGDYTMSIDMHGMPTMQDTGKYVTVWERQPDGAWKIKIETWNTNKMPMMPPMAEEMMGEHKMMGEHDMMGESKKMGEKKMQAKKTGG